MNTKNEKTNSHPEAVAEGSNKRFFAFAQNDVISQNGRSMVEMLGVLAVIGVLSIAGVSGYTTAMKKHRANELLNEASKRAVVLAMKVAAGQDLNEHSLAEFGNNTVNGATFRVDQDKDNRRFILTLTGVDEDVCKQMQVSAGTTGIIRDLSCGTPSDGKVLAELVFNDDLSTNMRAADYKTKEDCGTPYVWCTTSNKCQEIGENCALPEPKCPFGTGTDTETYKGSPFTVTEGKNSITCYCEEIREGWDGNECVSVINLYVNTSNAKTHSAWIDDLENGIPICPEGYHWATLDEATRDFNCIKTESGGYTECEYYTIYGSNLLGWLKTCAESNSLTAMTCDTSSTGAFFIYNQSSLISSVSRTNRRVAVCRR